MRVRLHRTVRATLIALIAAPGLAAQQSSFDALHTSGAGHVPLFPRAIGVAAPAAPAEPNRSEMLAREIDSIGEIGGRMQSAAAAREETARSTSRFLLLSQLARGLERRPDGTRAMGMDWISAVTAAGVTQLARTSLFAPDLSGPGFWSSLRSGGQFAGLAAITGGASWLLSSLALRPPLGVLHPHIVPVAHGH